MRWVNEKMRGGSRPRFVAKGIAKRILTQGQGAPSTNAFPSGKKTGAGK
jgi:hypothetical protein